MGSSLLRHCLRTDFDRLYLWNRKQTRSQQIANLRRTLMIFYVNTKPTKCRPTMEETKIHLNIKIASSFTKFSNAMLSHLHKAKTGLKELKFTIVTLDKQFHH